ncbi:MAG: TIGR00296 family protein [Candidatus Woesearchaeota archaeon]|nr:MAG: TIGR00296 family protein [Candidatus Woesearchaeota archaeon]
MPLSLDQGKSLVRLARHAIDSAFTKVKISKPLGLPKGGIFVTLKRYPKGTLKGCIGFIRPIPLAEGIINAARSAAFEDPRFPPVRKEEFDDICVEISILTEPKEVEINSEADLKKIRVGKDGLIVSKGSLSGLLLPQVATEEQWNARTFIRGTCMKAGLGSEAWRDPLVKVYKFQAQIFKEVSPEGEVVEEVISRPVK